MEFSSRFLFFLCFDNTDEIIGHEHILSFKLSHSETRRDPRGNPGQKCVWGIFCRFPFLLNLMFQPAAVGVRGDLLQHLHLLLAMLLQLLQVKLAVLPEFWLTLFCLLTKQTEKSESHL